MTPPLLGIDLAECSSAMVQGLGTISVEQIYKSFATLFASIDPVGVLPIVLSLISKGKTYNSGQAAISSAVILIAFLFIGEALLKSFGADISTFGVAGGIVLFVMSFEMIFGMELFKPEGDSGSNATFVPLVFPLFAGAASFTTLLTLRSAGFAPINLLISIVLNMVLVYFVLRYASLLDRVLGKNGVYILRKFFGVILLAISVQFITKNLIDVIAMVQHGVASFGQ